MLRGYTFLQLRPFKNAIQFDSLSYLVLKVLRRNVRLNGYTGWDWTRYSENMGDNRSLKMSQNLIKHISTKFLNFGTKSHQSRYLF